MANKCNSTKNVYNGFGKLQLTQDNCDKPFACTSNGNSSNYAPVGDASVIISNSTVACNPCSNSSTVIRVAGVNGAGEGVMLGNLGITTNLASISQTGYLSIDMQSAVADVYTVILTDKLGNTNTLVGAMSTAGGKFERFPIALSSFVDSPFDFSVVEFVEIISQGGLGEFYVDKVQFFEFDNDFARCLNYTLGCFTSMEATIDQEQIDVPCSDGAIIDVILQKPKIELEFESITISTDMYKLLAGGSLASGSLLKKTEILTVVNGIATLTPSSNIFENRLWVRSTSCSDASANLSCATCSFADSVNVPAGQYVFNSLTNEIRMDSNFNGQIEVTYRAEVNTGSTLSFTGVDTIESSLYIEALGPNKSTILYYYPRVQINLTGIGFVTGDSGDLQTDTFVAKVLADDKGVYFKVIDNK